MVPSNFTPFCFLIQAVAATISMKKIKKEKSVKVHIMNAINIDMNIE
jgi:hypothetical protein